MNIIFPTEPKVQYPYSKTPIFSTMIKRSAGRREYRATYWPSSPLWEFSIPLNGISREDMMIIGGFLTKVRGALHSFFFRDAAPAIEGEQSVQGIYNTDYSIYDELANVGNGVQTQFQLFRNWNWWYLEYPKFPPFGPTGYGVGGLQGDSSTGEDVELGFGVPIWETPYIYLDGVLQDSGYAISQAGVVTFDAAPGLNVVITADFGFYYRCRFKEDYSKLSRIAPEVWKSDELVLVTVDE